MSVPVFNRIISTLYELSTLTETGLTGYWAGYQASTDLGSEAGTATVWQDAGGFYLFLDKRPGDFAQFCNDLSAIRPKIDPSGQLRFVWLLNADQPPARWQITPAFVGMEGLGETIVWTLVRSFSLSIGAYLLTVSGRQAFSYISDQNGGGIEFGNGNFTGPEGGYPVPSLQMSFSGSGLCAFAGELTIPPPAGNAYDLWKALNIGLQYASAPILVTEEADRLTTSATDILFMPVFERQMNPLDLDLLFDPLNPLVATRTSIGFSASWLEDAIALGTYFKTTYGYSVQVTPLAGNSTIPSARLVMGSCPVTNDYPQEGVRYHLSPDGAFLATVVTPEDQIAGDTDVHQLLVGLSGVEYITLPGSSTNLIFEGNKPAYLPPATTGQNGTPDVSQALTEGATTSYLTVLSGTSPATSPVYYAQSEQAPLFSGRERKPDGSLTFNPIPVLVLTYPVGQKPAVFPVGIYAGLTQDDVSLAVAMENAGLAPYRNYCIGQGYGNSSPAAAETTILSGQSARDETNLLGVTPQGLIAKLSADYQQMTGLILGNMPGTNYPSLDLTAVKGKFKQSLLSNQVFFVAANADIFMEGTSVRYMLTDDAKPWLLSKNVPQAVIDSVYEAVSNTMQPFETEDAYISCIGEEAGMYLPYFLEAAGLLKVEMEGWTFQLSPRAWRKDPQSPTLMIVKFCSRSLSEIIIDSASWSWPEVAVPENGTLAQTQSLLIDLINEASTMSGDMTPLGLFYRSVLNNPDWNGFLFLNVPVAIAELPSDLTFVTSGTDPAMFYAHHIGFSQTPFGVIDGVPQPGQTATFGLIDYQDPVDLYRETTIPFAFKTTKISVRFSNAAIAGFFTEVELMLNELLASVLSKKEAARGNNLIIQGSYQRVGNTPRYTFSLTGQNVFYTNNSALTSIEVLSVQLVPGTLPDPGEVLVNFILSGNLRFIWLDTFDLFSFGPGGEDTDSWLRFGGLTIGMHFNAAAPGVQSFTVQTADVAFDLPNSASRGSSLVNNFPLTVSGMIASEAASLEGTIPASAGQTPEDMGYTSVAAPLDQTPMAPTWYGLVFSLDLGTFGALSGSESFVISVLAAWSKGTSQDNLPVYLGLKLPGIAVLSGSFPLQGVLTLGFRSFQFETYISNDEKLSYRLRLRNFSLSVFIWSFPPGNADIILFGQPGNPSASLGWYAVYADETDSLSNRKN